MWKTWPFLLDFHSLFCFLLVPPIEILQKHRSNILNLGNFLTSFLQVQVFYKVYVWINFLGRKMNTFGFGKSCHLHIFASAGYWKQQQQSARCSQIFNTLKHMQSFAQKYFSKSCQYSSSCLLSFLFQICGYNLKQTRKEILSLKFSKSGLGGRIWVLVLEMFLFLSALEERDIEWHSRPCSYVTENTWWCNIQLVLNMTFEWVHYL